MAGLCFGGIGIGACKDATKDTSSTKIVNTALAYAMDKSVFSCKAAVNAGNKTHAAGMCGCAQLGIAPGSASCASYQSNLTAFQQQCTLNLMKNPPKDKTQLQSLICACKSTSGCNIGISQDSAVTSEQTCNNTAKSTQDLKSNFSNNVVDSLKSTMSDIGGLFDSNSQSSIKDIANSISQNVTSTHLTEIENTVNASQSVTAGCGGINFGVTQVSRFNNILTVLNKTENFQGLSSKIDDIVKTSITRTNNGFLGWLNNANSTVLIMVIFAVVILGAIYYFFYYKKGQTDAAVAQSSPNGAEMYFASRYEEKEEKGIFGGSKRSVRGYAGNAPRKAVLKPAPAAAPAAPAAAAPKAEEEKRGVIARFLGKKKEAKTENKEEKPNVKTEQRSPTPTDQQEGKPATGEGTVAQMPPKGEPGSTIAQTETGSTTAETEPGSTGSTS